MSATPHQSIQQMYRDFFSINEIATVYTRAFRDYLPKNVCMYLVGDSPSTAAGCNEKC